MRPTTFVGHPSEEAKLKYLALADLARWGFDVPFDLNCKTHLEVAMTYDAVTHIRNEERKIEEKMISEQKRDMESIKRSSKKY